MKIKVLNLSEGYLADDYSKYAKQELKREGVPFVSFPIEFTDLPNNTKSIALTFIDYDSVPVCGFPWIHWLASDISPKKNILEENSSDINNDEFIQGCNSWISPLANIENPKIVHQYGGPTPPDKDHDYTLTIYALDKELNLKNGYFLNEFIKASRDHILEKVELTVKGRK